MKKILDVVVMWWIITFLICASLITFVKPLQSSNINTNNDKFYLYENNQLNFSIKYPSNWIKMELYSLKPQQNEPLNIVGFRKDVPKNENMAPVIGISVMKIDPTEPIKKIYEKFILGHILNSKNWTSLEKEEEIILNGIDAHKVSVNGIIKNSQWEDIELKAYDIMFVKDGYLFSLHYNNSAEKFEPDSKDAYSILSSINLNYSNKTDWDYAIYENNDYDIKFKYPNGWIQANANPQYGFISRFFNPKSISNKVNQENIALYISESDIWSLDELKDYFIKSWKSNFPEFQLEKVEKNINNQEWYKILFSYLQSDGIRIKEFSFIQFKDWKNYNIDIFPVETLTEAQINDIVSSFEFLES